MVDFLILHAVFEFQILIGNANGGRLLNRLTNWTTITFFDPNFHLVSAYFDTYNFTLRTIFLTFCDSSAIIPAI